MKKVCVFILAFLFVLLQTVATVTKSGEASAESTGIQSKGGIDFKLRGGVTGYLRDDSVNMLLCSGPSYKYTQEVFYGLDCSVVKVFSQVWSDGSLWALVEADEYDLGKIRGYVEVIDNEGNRRFTYDQSAVPWETSPNWGSFPDLFYSVWSCQCFDKELMRYGPGVQYPLTGTYFGNFESGYVVLTEGDWALVDCPAHDPEGWATRQRGWILFSELIY